MLLLMGCIALDIYVAETGTYWHVHVQPLHTGSTLKVTRLNHRLLRYYKLSIGSSNIHLNYQQLKGCFATCHWIGKIPNINLELMFSAAWCILQSDMIKHHKSPPYS